ncbi:hypothetical protein EYF80_049877 [Liparis tanakae]|uniref:Uncharacterized protein n=1 Tax=Liparis tanakae TaxID=230148 RepID=A0A4Z2FGC9_9TELE|nr:hypothetical protein EYF80_049877 [Liparis tanakae]
MCDVPSPPEASVSPPGLKRTTLTALVCRAKLERNSTTAFPSGPLTTRHSCINIRGGRMAYGSSFHDPRSCLFAVHLLRPPHALRVREDLFQDLIDYVALIIHLAEVQSRHEGGEKAPDVAQPERFTFGGQICLFLLQTVQLTVNLQCDIIDVLLLTLGSTGRGLSRGELLDLLLKGVPLHGRGLHQIQELVLLVLDLGGTGVATRRVRLLAGIRTGGSRMMHPSVLQGLVPSSVSAVHTPVGGGCALPCSRLLFGWKNPVLLLLLHFGPVRLGGAAGH